MSIAHVASAIAGASSPVTTVTTAGVNATGANFSVIGASWYNAGGLGSFAVSDSNANIYTARTQQNSTVQYARLWYSQGGIYGSGMTATATGDVNCFPTAYFAAFSGVHATPYDSENGNTTGSATSLSCGNILPSEDNCLIVAFGGLYTASGISIDQGFTALTQNYGAGTNLAGAGAYLVQTAAALKNPTWSWTTAERGAAVIAAFKGPGATGIAGALSATLDAATASSAGAVVVAGSLAATLAAVTDSAAGAVRVSGAMAETLRDVSPAAAGTVRVAGALAATLDATSSSAAGTVAVAGSAGVTLDSLAPSASGAVAVAGGADIALGAAGLAAAGLAIVGGSLSVTLDEAAATAAGSVLASGALSATLDAAAIDAQGTVGGPTTPATPEGVFRRAESPRLFGRRPGTPARRFGRDAVRLWRWKGMANRMPADTLTKTERETPYFLFDFSNTAEVRDGWVLSSPTVNVPAGLTAGTATVTTTDIYGVAAGEAVVVQISGGDEDDAAYSVSCTATASKGGRSATLEVPGKLVVAGVGV